ncbi:MFS general substrate transporter [Zopfia rhizophila CBS 207.26]|uniref:MFS general substrate transporter n=1 Tax=Zopfia rhizophila CBS 207.26 TaxID=1314779 RepID=A0A6A6EJ43_9PEZI|nr:MFS general substrate transporter [Zopfia rhizophila CBS 207.26]
MSSFAFNQSSTPARSEKGDFKAELSRNRTSEELVPESNGKAPVETGEEQEENSGEEVSKTQQWLILSAAVIQSFLTIGYTQAFGVFQAHYGSDAAVKDHMLLPSEGTDTAAIAAVGALGGGGIMMMFGFVYQPWVASIGQHVKLLLPHLLITQGVITGLGSGLLQSTLNLIVPEYFSKHGALAQGVIFAGGGLGGFFYAPVLRLLLQKLGSREALGILASIQFILGSVVSAITQRPRKFKKRSYRIVSCKAFENPIFTLLMLVNLLHPLTIGIPMIFSPGFSGFLGFDVTQAAMLLALASAVGIPARILLGFLADKIGHQNALLFGTATNALITWILWILATQTNAKTLWITFIVLFGIVNGCFTILIAPITIAVFEHEFYFSYSGALNTIKGLGYLVGPIVAGAILGNEKEEMISATDFLRLILYTGVLQTMCTCSLILVRILYGKKRGWEWIR